MDIKNVGYMLCAQIANSINSKLYLTRELVKNSSELHLYADDLCNAFEYLQMMIFTTEIYLKIDMSHQSRQMSLRRLVISV